MPNEIIRTYVFSIKIVDMNNCIIKDSYVGDARIHIYENTSVEKALSDLQLEVGGGYEIVSMYSEPFYLTPTNGQTPSNTQATGS